MGDIGRTLDTFGKEKLGPAIGVAVKALDNSVQILPSQQLHSINSEKKKLGPAAKEAGNCMGEHPVEASLIIGSVLPLFVPSLASGPVLWMFGWVFELVRSPPPFFSFDCFGDRVGCYCNSSCCGWSFRYCAKCCNGRVWCCGCEYCHEG